MNDKIVTYRENGKVYLDLRCPSPWQVKREKEFQLLREERVKTMTEELRQEIFEYLDELKNGKRMNMFAAASCTAIEFNICIYDAEKILAEWIKN